MCCVSPTGVYRPDERRSADQGEHTACVMYVAIIKISSVTSPRASVCHVKFAVGVLQLPSSDACPN
jgi:hypothetical protein